MAAPTVNTVNSGGGSAVTSVSFSLTPGGSNRHLIVGIGFYRNTNTFVSNVTFNSVGATQDPNSMANNASTYYVQQWHLTAPAATTANVVATFGGSTAFEIGIGAVAFADADQSTPIGTAVATSGTSTSPASPSMSSSADDLIIDTLTIVHNGTLTPSGGQTQRWNATVAGFIKTAGSTKAGAASVSTGWGNTTSQAWAIAAVPIRGIVAGGGNKAGPLASGPILKSLVGGALAA